MDLTVVVATFGDEKWIERARTVAIPSAEALGLPVLHVHGETLAGARNEGLVGVKTEWVVHLDADDELESGYVEAMASGSRDLRAPAVRYVGRTINRAPYVPRVAGHHHPCSADCLSAGNWLVVGSAVRAEMAMVVGGWREWPVYEDWDLWMRCWQAGATVEAIPTAVYRAHVNPHSRNRAPSMEEKNRIHHQIVEANLGPVAA